ncbi:sugar nucleotide-binding protein [Allorhodopirellula solitaria]|uniref:dTDP-4-dehydrorhamnose reductase n=1 Tax=Allorhodopirellula solitaria TaxID=2527987 RepID=A0A5C5WZA4_9BACT|nr:sugar nucleotide-binding protein [Allorhodopirellula solitaria]TWT55986.1 dTDP-4-dehydrorhamnose reductase [Allorhodopirellula solitaria]
MRFVLLGFSGYVGSEFARQIIAWGHQLIPLNRDQCDLHSADAISRFLREVSADAMINCAGYTGKPNVDACESDKVNCLAGNAVLPSIVATACQRTAVPWGHVSSGCIYRGRRQDGRGFCEIDPPNFSFRQNNCSFYSGTKAMGEELLADFDGGYIWRLRIPFSRIDSSRNYLSKLMRYNMLLEAENSLSHLTEFANAAIRSFELQVPFGIYNLTNPGSVTTSEVVAMIREAGISNKDFRFFDSEEQFMQLAAKTPRSNCVLDSAKAVAAGLNLSPVREALRASLLDWKSG